MPGTIKFVGGVALMVSGMTGPSIAVIPQLFQDAGWFTPLLTFVVVTALSGAAALLLVEAMASIAGNEKFQAAVEYSTLAELFLGHRWHWVFQIMLYIALQSQTITSLIESFQSMDTLLVTIARKSCAISFTKGWECVSTIPDNGLGVFPDYILISFGYLITLALVLPLGLIQLSDNIKFQIASFLTLVFITIVWIVTFFQVGITNHPIPAIGISQGSVVGYVISNFAFVTTVPAFVNNIHPSANIHRIIWLSLIISCVIYLVIGLAGAGAFNTPPNSTILAVISTRRPSIIALISVYLFPLAVLITSIPVFMIVIRYNLLRGNICSKPWAIFWSSILPWIIVIPFQTNGWLTIIMNWTSLLFSSGANLVVPFVLYLLSKRYRASAVLDSHHDLDEFQLRPLERSDSSSNYQPGSPLPELSQTNTEEPTSYPIKPMLTLPDAKDDDKWSDKIIRLIRSPSIHRYYGEPVAGGSSTAHAHRRLSLSKATELTEGEKSGLISPVSLGPHRHRSVPGSIMASRRGSNTASPMHSPTRVRHMSVPDITIETPSIVNGKSTHLAAADAEQGSVDAPLPTSPYGLRLSIEKFRKSPVLSSPQEEAEDMPSTPGTTGEFVNGGGALVVDSTTTATNTMVPPDDESSFHTTEDQEMPRWTFEAFPRLNRMRWFNSTIVTIVFCMLTTIMVSANVIYNIVLAAHGNYQK